MDRKALAKFSNFFSVSKYAKTEVFRAMPYKYVTYEFPAQDRASLRTLLQPLKQKG